MGKNEKVIIDTNIFISAFGWGGRPLEVVELLEKEEIRNCISEGIFNELFVTLLYPKLSFPIKFQTEILEFVLAHSDFYTPKENLKLAPDPKDNKFIECALTANAKFIITGDKSFLSLKQFRGIKITTPEDFLKMRK
ncbi:MAG: putative toxin-antitoxin system toxin component, PIN family [Nitrospirae bacterium CG_4_10_14_0_8_um_filter_41_23]|nr:MAG: putative toxin-antitoxin system toxin component, PIN family [Nitrospirae bacterium CG11_big_fil_rev_8_21_14_0_20_41_14]PIV42846.1 MAG: putative toxin-antitoxin system toxin component, PIN family [Nitrospirae bacterium CG02_land_8_20_14_3_00_41_53]PIW87649.1 MAG: putative toxin-antitoxin system toxin component, PIN family [Nitrospirae bacterium CG_4_8_14_3_um_filter_41_47]PIY85925.1 MAG: putative toxin-antitoxin system toxin component, PIN family [Nitrospirae bacterium CG_4_10_14_0_8_um_f